MNFVVPTEDGEGWMTPEEAEGAWQGCRKGAEGETTGEALARRVYSIQYRHNGQTLDAVVGERDPLDGEVIMAIIAFPGFYKICTTTRGYRTVGDTPMVGVHDVVNFEDFDPASYG